MFGAPSEHPRLLDMKRARVSKLYPWIGSASLKAHPHGSVNQANAADLSMRLPDSNVFGPDTFSKMPNPLLGLVFSFFHLFLFSLSFSHLPF